MRKWKPLAFATAALCLAAAPVGSQGSESGLWGGEVLSQDPPAIARSGATLIPMRPIFSQLGAAVSWDATAKTAVATKEGLSLRLTLGRKQMLVNGQPVPLDIAPEMWDGSVMVPLAAVAKAFGATVRYDSASRMAIIIHGGTWWRTLVWPGKPDLTPRQAAELVLAEVALEPETKAIGRSGFRVVKQSGQAIHCVWENRAGVARMVMVMSRDRSHVEARIIVLHLGERDVISFTWGSRKLEDGFKSLGLPTAILEAVQAGPGADLAGWVKTGR